MDMYKSGSEILDVLKGIASEKSGHMVNVSSMHPVDYCFVENYPVEPVNLLGGIIDGQPAGVYVAVHEKRILYVHYAVVVVEVANKNDITKFFPANGELRVSHGGDVYCSARRLSDLSMFGGNISVVESVFTPGLFTYVFVLPAIPAGRFSGTEGEFFGFYHTNGGSVLREIGIKCLYFGFVMSEVKE